MDVAEKVILCVDGSNNTVNGVSPSTAPFNLVSNSVSNSEPEYEPCVILITFSSPLYITINLSLLLVIVL